VYHLELGGREGLHDLFEITDQFLDVLTNLQSHATGGVSDVVSLASVYLGTGQRVLRETHGTSPLLNTKLFGGLLLGSTSAASSCEWTRMSTDRNN